MRHCLAVVLALAACALAAGVASRPAVGEWIADAPEHVLEGVGARPGALLPGRVLLNLARGVRRTSTTARTQGAPPADDGIDLHLRCCVRSDGLFRQIPVGAKDQSAARSSPRSAPTSNLSGTELVEM
ncbi:hypothetical protein AB0I69_36340 [Streptomyces sp. NPDC050508]|uniref:hypothetical protein n=1 Tax=Streptomyces sp. NPDC050508 TaxID=3155405 RepID=UPI00341DB274